MDSAFANSDARCVTRADARLIKLGDGFWHDINSHVDGGMGVRQSLLSDSDDDAVPELLEKPDEFEEEEDEEDEDDSGNDYDSEGMLQNLSIFVLLCSIFVCATF